MSMMYATGLMIALMVFLVVVTTGAFLAVRLYGGRQVRDDHPR
ncbi:MAG: hypothetical protein WKF79_01425 [Nocardioides sp.]